MLAHRNRQAKLRTVSSPTAFNRVIQTGIFAGMMTGLPPSSWRPNALDIANLRRGNVSQRFTDGQTGGRQKSTTPPARAHNRHRFAVVAVEAGDTAATSAQDLRAPSGHRATTGGYGRSISEQGKVFPPRSADCEHVYRVGNRRVIRAVWHRPAPSMFAHGGSFSAFAQQDIQRLCSDRLIVEMVIMQREMLFFGSVANDHAARVRAYSSSNSGNWSAATAST